MPGAPCRPHAGAQACQARAGRPRRPPRPPAAPRRPQATTTALAETPGSRFTDECEALLREERYSDLLDRFAQHLDMVLSKSASDTGAARRGAAAEGRQQVAGACCANAAAAVAGGFGRPRLPTRPPRRSPRADVECCLNITCHLVPRIPAQQGLAAAKRLAAALAAQVGICPESREAAAVQCAAAPAVEEATQFK